MKTLAEQNQETTLRICSIAVNGKTKKFLTSLGLIEGESVTLISKASGSYVLSVKDGRYAIDKGLASQILVEEVSA